jgi:nucleoid DNA-binding protein
MPAKSVSATRPSPAAKKKAPAGASRRRRSDRALTKRDLVMAIAAESEIAQEIVYAVLQGCLDRMTEALAEGRHIEFRDFGVFELARRRSRIGRNPNQPEHTVTIPERKVVKFKPGKRMKELVAKA